MPEPWITALDVAVRRTGHVDLRRLCDSAHPDHEQWRKQVIVLAGQDLLAIPATRPPHIHLGNNKPQAPQPVVRVPLHTGPLHGFTPGGPQNVSLLQGGCCGGNTTGPQLMSHQPAPLARPMRQELVVARYNENISWLHDTPLRATVYNKGQTVPQLNVPHQLESLPNTGREAGTWLYHIIRHYDELADWTYFLQGDARQHQPDILERLRNDYDCPTCLATRYREREPMNSIKQEDQVWTDKQGWEMRLGNARAQSHPNIPLWFNIKAWEFIFIIPCPDPLRFCYTAQWAVSRDSIRGRSKQFYQWLQTNLTEEGDKTFTDPPLNPWSLEALWRYIWDPSYETRVK